YAVRESSSSIRLFKSFKEKARPATSALVSLGYAAEEIFGGSLLGVRGAGGTLTLYDWETEQIVRRIDVEAKSIYWSESGELFAVATEDSYFVLRLNREAFVEHSQQSGGAVGDEGVEEAIEFVTEIQESVKSGCWIGDCFIYTNTANRLNYLVGGQVFTISHFDTSMTMLGYVARDNRIYLADKEVGIVSYVLPLPVIEYQTAILRGDLEMAQGLLPSIPSEQRSKIAQFLEAEDMKELALEVTTDPEQRFDLAVQLNQLETAYALAEESDAEAKWRIVGDCALRTWNFDLAERCMVKAKDLSGLLLLYTSSGNAAGMSKLAEMAETAGANNIAFSCYQALQQNEKCYELLLRIDRVPEAALFARTYLPAKVEDVVPKWKELLVGLGKHKAADAIANPKDYANLFPDFDRGMAAAASHATSLASAGDYPQHKDGLFRDLLSENGALPTATAESEACELSSAEADEADEADDIQDEADVDDIDAEMVEAEAEVDDEFHEASPAAE
ncbi:Coatomer subunit beta', partial [Coemansia sp. RSA 1694]